MIEAVRLINAPLYSSLLRLCGRGKGAPSLLIRHGRALVLDLIGDVPAIHVFLVFHDARTFQPHSFHRMAIPESDANQTSRIGITGSPTWKGMIMRTLTTSAIIAVLSFGAPAFVQAQGAPSQSEAQTPPAQSSTTTIRSIQVVDVKELQPAVRSKVDEIVAQSSEQDLQSLRQSLDAAPAAVSALKAKNLTSSQVVAINISDGVLTIFAKTA